MASFCSRSLQYKKLSCLQREGRAQHCVGMALLLFYTTHIITGRLGFGGKKSWTQPWKCTVYPPSLQQAGRQDLPCGPILSQGCHPLPVLRHGSTVRWKEALEMKHCMEPRGGGEPEPSWVQPEPEPSWVKPEPKGANLSWSRARQSGQEQPRRCCVESSPASEVVAQWDVGSLTFGDLSVIAFWRLRLRDRESSAGSGHNPVFVPTATWN